MTPTNQLASLTSSRETHGVVPLPRIHRAMPAGQRTVPNALASLGLASPASELQPCLNPLCPGRKPASARTIVSESAPTDSTRTGSCAWPQRGRPGYFCSSPCRDQYDYERTQLAEDIQALAEAIASPGGTYRDRRKVQAELAKRRWAWQRYLFDPAQVTHTEPPPEKGAT